MLVFREQSHVFGDIDFLNRNKRCLCFNALQHSLCLVTEWAILFCVELELYRKIHTSEFSTSRQKSHLLFTPIIVDSVIESC